jgi:hypothetical protein
VVRIRTTDQLDTTLDRLARTPAVGVLLRLAASELDSVLDDVLPAARRRSVVGSPGTGTLRERLGLPVPSTPDLADHALAFDTVPNPGGRL